LEPIGEERFHHAGKLADSRLGSGGDDVATWAVGAGVEPSVGAAEAHRAGTAVGAPVPCPALPRLELDEGGRSGFISAQTWDGLGADGLDFQMGVDG
jgi:hypothetical protein